ncbi:MAG: four helix bundle protein [Bacteroidaceae bacterium]|nr:four helix bundle protein [Bacteroidaceae bacterium]
MSYGPLLQKSKQFAIRIIRFYSYLQKEKNECVISKQILRSGTSIGANARESNNAQSSADFINKLSIALKEADETAYWLELLHESGIIDEQHFSSMYSDLKELIALLTASIKTSKQNNNIKKVESGKMKDESFPTYNSEK